MSNKITQKGKPWDLFSTLLILGLIGLAMIITSYGLLYIFYLQALSNTPDLSLKIFLKTISKTDSLIIGTTSIGSTIIALILIFYFSYKKQGITISDYLGLKAPPWTEYLKWFGILLLAMIANGIIGSMLGQAENSSKFTTNLVANSQYFWLLAITVSIAAPLLEEFVMRGFLLTGLSHAKWTDIFTASALALVSFGLYYGINAALALQAQNSSLLLGSTLADTVLMILIAAIGFYGIYWFYKHIRSEAIFGVVGAIILTSLFWSLLHTQYGWYNLSFITVLGILFGIARLKTGSLYIPIFLHAVHNGIAILAISYILAEKAATGGG